MTRRCKCEHWQVCPVCAPQMFDGDGNLLPPEPTPLEAAKQEIKRLRAELAEVQRDAERYRWLRGDSCADHSVRWTQWEVRCWEAPRWTDDLRRDALDAAIDRARDEP